jgi:MFS family permease
MVSKEGTNVMADNMSTIESATPSSLTQHGVSRSERESASNSSMPSGKSSRHTSLTHGSSLDIIKTPTDLTPQITEKPMVSSVREHTVPSAIATPSPRPPVATILAYTALCISIFLVALDSVLIPTALPTISESFHISDSVYAWTGSAYLLANAASIPFWGTLADVFGRKPNLLVALGIFLVGSIVCAVSINAPMLVAGRTVQGLGGGGVNCLVYVCVSDLFAIRFVTTLHRFALGTTNNTDSDRSFYLGIVGAVWAVASALGPVLGGIFAEDLSWRWCFYINLPIVSFSIVLLYFTLHLHNPRTPFLAGMYRIDWLGTFTILAATILFLVGLQTGGTRSWSEPMVIVLLVLGGLAYLLFPVTQWYEDTRGGSPIMPLRIFRDRSNLSALAVCAFDALIFNSIAYFVPLYFQIVAAKGPLTTGVLMLALAVPLTIVSFTSGFVIEKTGRFMNWLQSGLVVSMAGIAAMASLTPSSSLAKSIGFLIVMGAGFGPVFHAPLIALQTRITEKDMAVGTATFGFVRMLFGAVGLVIGQVIFQALMSPQLSAILAAGVNPELAHQLAGGEAVSLMSAVAQLDSAQKAVVRSGFMSALRGAFICYAVVAALGVAASLGIKRVTLKRDTSGGSLGEAVADRVADIESSCGGNSRDGAGVGAGAATEK